MESSKYRCLIARRNEGTSNNHVVLVIKAGRRKVVIYVVNFKSFQWIKVILRPFPSISSNIMMSSM